MPASSDSEADILRERAYFILDAFEQAEPGPSVTKFRDLVRRATRVSDLRTINRELRGMMAALERSALLRLRQGLLERFGPDSDHERDKAIAAKARARGRIRSEREYRSVQAYADSIAAEMEFQDDFTAFGALLDEYMSRAAS